MPPLETLGIVRSFSFFEDTKEEEMCTQDISAAAGYNVRRPHADSTIDSSEHTMVVDISEEAFNAEMEEILSESDCEFSDHESESEPEFEEGDCIKGVEGGKAYLFAALPSEPRSGPWKRPGPSPLSQVFTPEAADQHDCPPSLLSRISVKPNVRRIQRLGTMRLDRTSNAGAALVLYRYLEE